MENQINVLVLDDDIEEFEILTKKFLRNQDKRYKFYHSTSFEEALQKLEAQDVDIALVDYNLAGTKTGVDFIDYVKSHSIDIPLILLTGFDEIAIDKKAQTAGADDYLFKKEMSYHAVEKAIRYALERSRIQKESIAQQLRLSQQVKMSALGEMASGIAHEINNPVAVITAVSSLLRGQIQQGKVDIAKIEDGLNRIEKMGFTIAKIIKSLKAVQCGDYAHPHEKISLSELIDNCIELCRSKVKHNDIRLEILVDKSIELECRISEISQVIVNLINNSADAIAELDSRWIRVSANIDGEYVDIRVTDSGSGLDEQISEKIWTPYFSTKGRKAGTGLGMSISKKIVESHAGEISYNSNSPNTEFLITLPITKKTKQRKRILIVDDDETVCDLLELNLENTNADLLVAHDGTQALSMFSRYPFDIVITDINLPGISGTTLCDEIFEIVKDSLVKPKIVVISGSPNLKVSQKVNDHLDPTFLPKPFDPEKLVEICFTEGALPTNESTAA